MTYALKSLVSILFGLGVVAGGVIRYVNAASNAALWFGVVMGAAAIAAGVLFRLERPKIAFAVGMLTVLFVGGFFISQFPKGGNYASVRVMLTIAASVVEGIVLLIPAKVAAEESSADAPSSASS